mmetsp:Transcript_15469/g.48115  ORF Transcript_15469/g.48115 Transcript_15469/m.48115 type:complete len:554 (-) Transcript_15469:716-2377(-)
MSVSASASTMVISVSATTSRSASVGTLAMLMSASSAFSTSDATVASVVASTTRIAVPSSPSAAAASAPRDDKASVTASSCSSRSSADSVAVGRAGSALSDARSSSARALGLTRPEPPASFSIRSRDDSILDSRAYTSSIAALFLCRCSSVGAAAAAAAARRAATSCASAIASSISPLRTQAASLSDDCSSDTTPCPAKAASFASMPVPFAASKPSSAPFMGTPSEERRMLRRTALTRPTLSPLGGCGSAATNSASEPAARSAAPATSLAARRPASAAFETLEVSAPDCTACARSSAASCAAPAAPSTALMRAVPRRTGSAAPLASSAAGGADESNGSRRVPARDPPPGLRAITRRGGASCRALANAAPPLAALRCTAGFAAGAGFFTAAGAFFLEAADTEALAFFSALSGGGVTARMPVSAKKGKRAMASVADGRCRPASAAAEVSTLRSINSALTSSQPAPLSASSAHSSLICWRLRVSRQASRSKSCCSRARRNAKNLPRLRSEGTHICITTSPAEKESKRSGALAAHTSGPTRCCLSHELVGSTYFSGGA